MENEKNYSKVQFVGHVLCTTPALKASVEEMSDWGIYLGYPDDSKDIEARLNIVSSVLKQVFSTRIDDSANTLKVFALPEFFWRGLKGAYLYPDGANDVMYKKISSGLTQMLARFKTQYDLSDWLFLFGSILTTNDTTQCTTTIDPTLSKVGDDFLSVYSLLSSNLGANAIGSTSRLLKIIDQKQIADNPADEKLSALLADILGLSDQLAQKKVYNRCFIYYGGKEYSIQKENKSKEDFILNNPSTQPNTVDYYLQTMVDYPPVAGVLNPVDTITYSTFKCGNLSIGVEICLDHSRKRLMGYVYEQKISPVDIQLVISCGMQLKKDSIAAKEGGILFNCDGEYVLPNDAQNGDHCHSQLKTCSFSASSGPQLSDNIPAAQVIPVAGTMSTVLYPHGLGEIHVYNPMQIAGQNK
jgi:hypothetical protein